MKRIMIVDDEEIIANSLVNMLQKVFPETDIYPAYSADQAMEYLERAGFEIVVSDIQMPGITGIDLLKNIKSFYPSCHVIFLTGYGSFDYAYQALHYKADSYILKSEDESILIDAIRKCMAEIDQESHFQETLKLAEAKVSQYLPILKKEFLERLINYEAPTPAVLKSALSEYNISLIPERGTLILAARFDEGENAKCVEDLALLVCACLGDTVICECALKKPDAMLWLIQSSGSDTDSHVVSYVRGMADKLHRSVIQTLHVSVSFLMDTSLSTFESIHIQARKVLYGLTNTLSSEERRAFVYLNGTNEESASDHDLVQTVNQYINTHIGADLSLVALSEKVYLNPSYLSRRYKELTGSLLSDVITTTRIQKSKELLRDKSIRISDVAEQVGYLSSTHYIRIFKKVTGTTPQDWRMTHFQK